MRFSAFLLAAVVAVAQAADDPKPTSRADQVKAIETEYAAASKAASEAMSKAYKEAKTDQEKKDLRLDYTKKSGELRKAMVEKAMAIADENPADDTGLAALWLVHTTAGYGSPETAKVAKLIIEHHVGNPKIEPMVSALAQNGRETNTKFLNTLIERNPSKAVKGMAAYTLASAIKREAEGAKIKDADIPAKLAEATAALEKVVTDYGDVETSQYGRKIKIADMVNRQLDTMSKSPIGKPAMEIEAEDIDATKFKLSDYKGKAVMLTFWGTWCGPCMAMIPHEREIAKKFAGKPFALIGVNSDKDKDKLKERMEKDGITWRSFWNGETGPSGPIAKAWGVTGWPTIVLIDHTGVVRRRFLGNPGDADVDRLLEELVKKAESATLSGE